MEQIEADIKRVLEDNHKISCTIRAEEVKIDVLDKEIKLLDDRIRLSESTEVERQRMHNLLSYQSTLIARASSRTDLLRVLHEDLLNLFIRRKQLRQSDGAGGSSVGVPNISLSSGLSSGNGDNQGLTNDFSMPASMNIMQMTDVNENLEELPTEEQEQIPLGMKLFQINVNEDACLTPEDGSEYGDLQYKNDLLDNIAISMSDPNANVDNIFKEATETSDVACAESGDSKIFPKKMGCVNYRNLARRLNVDFDEVGNPVGPNAGAFKRSINSYVCQLLPVRFKQIGDVPAEDYKSVFNVLKERYNFDVNRSYTRKKISSCYRQHKYKLLIQVKKDLEKGIEPQKPPYVKKEDWDAFVAKTKDDEFDRISKKNKASRSQQSAVNRKGPSHSPLKKRKLKGSEQESVDGFIRPKVHKPKRGRPRKQLAVTGDNDIVADTVSLSVDQEGFESDQYLKNYPQLHAPAQFEYCKELELESYCYTLVYLQMAVIKHSSFQAFKLSSDGILVTFDLQRNSHSSVIELIRTSLYIYPS